MPLDQLLVFTNESGNSPLMDWLGELRKIELRAYAKCLQEIRGLTEFAHETPERVGRNRAKRLRDGICELRAKHGKVRYRVLYFFCGKAIACLSHGFKKGGKGDSESPNNEIDIAIKHRVLVIKNREMHATLFRIE